MHGITLSLVSTRTQAADKASVGDDQVMQLIMLVLATDFLRVSSQSPETQPMCCIIDKCN